MTESESEFYSVRRFRLTVVILSALLGLLILIGVLGHRRIPDDQPVWKSSPYGEPRDTTKVRAGH